METGRLTNNNTIIVGGGPGIGVENGMKSVAKNHEHSFKELDDPNMKPTQNGSAHLIAATNGSAANGIGTDPVGNGLGTDPATSSSTKGGHAQLCPVMNAGLKPQPLRYLITEDVRSDSLYAKARVEDNGCTSGRCLGSLMNQTVLRQPGVPRGKEDVLRQARDFLDQYHQSIKRFDTPVHKKRLTDVLACIEDTGTYELTSAELNFGAKTAWRNASRCIGRIQWSKLQVFDARHLTSARAMFEAICNHMKYGTNKGNIRSAITIFPPRTETGHDFRVWNPLVVRYAGYKQADGSVVGDPASVEFTQLCLKMGWRGGSGRFDILPLVLQADGQDPEMFQMPADLCMEVEISHPSYPWFEELGLRWYAVPAVSGMLLDCGGLEFTGCPFNGWFMAPEIATRDLCDANRYNVTELVAKKMGLDTRTNATLWKDKAMIEVNIAVLHSYQKSGVTLVDHHTASESFMKHLENEYRVRGGCPADWVWIVPPISGSLTPVFHQEMLNYKLKPSYEYQDDPWKRYRWKNSADDQNGPAQRSGKRWRFKDVARAIKFSAKLMRSALAKRIKCTVLYATETGKSERYAKTLCEMFKTAFDAKVVCMADYDFIELEHEALVFFVTSTFGNGDPPDNGISFTHELHSLRHPYQREKLKRSPSLTFVQEVSEKVDAANEENPSANQLSSTWQRRGGLLTSESVDTQHPEPFGNVRYSVFALGSTAYPNFCAFGKYLDQLMHELGGERINTLAEGDELCGQEEAFNNWSQATFKAACEAFCIEDQFSMDKASATLTKADTTWAPGKYRVTIVDDKQPTRLSEALSTFHNKKVRAAKLISRTQLQSPESDRQTILVRVHDQDHKELAFVPGDHLAVCPENRPELVNAILERLSLDIDPDAPVMLEAQKVKNTVLLGDMKYWETDERFAVTTLRRAFTHLVDITTPPMPPILLQFANLASSDEDRARLQKLAQDGRAYDEWKYTNQPTLADVMAEFPSVKFPPSLLLSQLPVLQPRYYSISCSRDVCPGEIHATVAVVKYRSKNGEGDLRHGVCSTWLNEIADGDTIPCFVKSAPQFHMPRDSKVPIIMVGPGTGVAPFRGFWQQRTFNKEQVPDSMFGPLSLYFGCRRSNMDDVYCDEKKMMARAGILEDIPVALSREPGTDKTYVQNLLMKNGQLVYEQITREHGHMYVCGDVAMAADVRKTLEKILETFGGFSTAEAKGYVVKMREQSLFHEDIFGITLKTFDVQKKARDKAVKKRWLNVVRKATLFASKQK